jgi:hypothetical protein
MVRNVNRNDMGSDIEASLLETIKGGCSRDFAHVVGFRLFRQSERKREGDCPQPVRLNGGISELEALYH